MVWLPVLRPVDIALLIRGTLGGICGGHPVPGMLGESRRLMDLVQTHVRQHSKWAGGFGSVGGSLGGRSPQSLDDAAHMAREGDIHI